jgi:hypothetical protein
MRMKKVNENDKGKWDKKLLDDINDRMGYIHGCLETLYKGTDGGRADIIHNVRKEIFDLDEILSDLILDGKTSKEILTERR